MTPSQLQGQSITVVGAARSGLAVSRLLARAGAKVFLTDRDAAAEGVEAALAAEGIAYEFGGHTERAHRADLAVVSPGVPSTAPLVVALAQSGIPVASEIEVASWFCRAPIVAITGTNGKTTTTSLTGYIFQQASTADGRPRRVAVAGNIGYPFADSVDDLTEDDLVVLEVSSFQLDHIHTFRPKVGVLLNLTPDHLDRYGYDFAQYAAAKYRLFENMGPGDTLIYNADDETLAGIVPGAAASRGLRLVPISLDADPGGADAAFVRDRTVVLRLHATEDAIMPTAQLALPGRHNLYNSLAAAVAARVMEVRSDVVRESLASFEGVPHRLEFVRELDDVRYINDSKATNVNAVWYALESFDQPIVLIAGGRDKGNDYASLRPLLREKGRAVIALGESAAKVAEGLGSVVPAVEMATSMEEAIRLAQKHAQPGDVVLLSPACASFDLFDNYEHRGDTFKRLVHAL